MNIGVEYIKYLWKAKKRHGIHSPFVYNFTDICLTTPIDLLDQKRIKKYQNKLNSDETLITIQDFGAGSKRLSNQRRIKDIYKNSSSKGKYSSLLYRLCRHYKPGSILEMGTSLGVGTIHMHLGSPSSKITTIDGCEQTAHVAKKMLDTGNFSPINTINSTFDHFFDHLPESVIYDLVFIDGHHDGTALINYLKRLEKHIHNDTLLVLDDIRWSDAMLHAWHSIVGNNRYHVTIDLFRMGLICSRQQQEKEHFIIRI